MSQSDEPCESSTGPARPLKGLARTLGVIIGTAIGALLAMYAPAALFMLNAPGLFSFVAGLVGVAALVSVLPLTLIGIRWPRPAAYGLLACALVELALLFFPKTPAGTTPSDVARAILLLVVPSALVAYLFIYSSSAEGGTHGLVHGTSCVACCETNSVPQLLRLRAE